MSELQDRLNALSGRGTPRGVDAVFDEATKIAQTTDEADVADDELDPIPFVTAEPARRPRRQRMSSLIAATGVTVLLLVSMLAVTAFLGSGGTNSPEGAVRRLADAISHEDPLAAADVLAPSEVQSLHDTLDAASKRAAELKLVQQAGAPLSGLDFNVDDLQLTAESLGPDHAKVRIQGGAIRARTEHEKFSPLVQKALGEPSTNEGRIDLRQGWGGDNAPQDLFVVAVREDGHWYISAAYTTLEYIRVGNQLPAADLGSGVKNIATLGADTPEAAVQNGMRALQASDWSALIALADPKELPLYDYRAALLGSANRNEVKTDFSISNMSATANVSGNTATVHLTAAGKTSSGDTWSLDGGCFTAPPSDYNEPPSNIAVGGGSAATDPTKWCVGKTFGSPFSFGLVGSSLGTKPGGPSEITVVQRDGRWFVSPVGTALDILNTWIANTDQRSLYIMLGQIESLPPDGTITLNTPVKFPETTGFGNAAVYEFHARAGQAVLADLTPHRADSECCYASVVILNPDGSYVSDGSMPLYGQAVTLPADGTYRVVVTVYDTGAQSFTLWDTAQAPADVRKQTGESCQYLGGGGTSCGSSGSGSLEPAGLVTPGIGTATPAPTIGTDSGETCVENSTGGFDCSKFTTADSSLPMDSTSIP